MRTWLGVATSGVHPVLRQHLELEEGFGVLVSHIPDGSPAAEAGLKPGDVLTMLDDQLLTTPEHLAILVRSKNKGDSIELTYLRKGEQLKTTVTLGEHELPKEIRRANSPQGYPGDWQGEMRKHQEEIERRMRDIRNRMPNRPGLDNNSRRRVPDSKNRPDMPPGPKMDNESTVKIDNDEGEVLISQKNGKGRIEIFDAEGKEVYSGPYDAAKGIKGLPVNAQDHLRTMKVDNIDLLAPTPVPVPPKPDPKPGKIEDAL